MRSARLSLAVELLSVLRILPRVELGRLTEGPGPLLRRFRLEGGRKVPRNEAERLDLKKAICWVDARMPGGGNCYRRSLLEVALDPQAAREPFFMGLQSDGIEKSGHAWLGEDGDGRPYDAVIPL